MPSQERYFDRLERFITSPEPNSQGEWRAFCPVHEDPSVSSTPSATFNFKMGVWHCNVNCGGGSLKQLVQIIEDDERESRSPFEGTKSNVRSIEDARAKREGIEPISEGKIKGYAAALTSEKSRLFYLRTSRGLSDATIKEREIGWDRIRERFTIPVRDEDGALVNIRRYKVDAPPAEKMKNSLGHGSPARLYPIDQLQHDTVVICEGEWDALVTIQNDFHVVTGTHGAGTWRAEWNKLFAGKTVYIIFDCDKEGRIAAKKVERQLQAHAASVAVVSLGLQEKGDLTDWFTEGHSAEELRQLMSAASAVSVAVPDATPAQPASVQVIGSMDSTTNGKPLSMQVTITGKKDPTYSVPHVARMECTMDAGPRCKICPMNTDWEGEHTTTIEPTDVATVARFIDAKEEKKLELLRQHIGAQKCTRLTWDPIENQTVEELFVTGSIDRTSNSHEEADYTQRRIYNIGKHETRTNTTASVIGTTLPSPKDSRNEFFAWHLEEAITSIDKFEMTPELLEQLKLFQPAEGQRPIDKLREIAQDFGSNVTHIVGRERLHMAMDLVYHSILNFPLDGKVISRGWLEFIVVGDTRTGKSETAIRLSGHYGLGHVIGCEGATFAGLVGGVKQIADAWVIQWGEITINDRRLVVLDEASGLSQDNISQMSDIRSRGVAQLTKIQSQETRARCRMIWITNPRKDKFVDEKVHYGIDILEGVIGNPEDIARFDFAMSVRSNDVPDAKINTADRDSVPHVYTSDLCRQLVLWAWSRKADQVEWKPDAYKLVYKNASLMGQRYIDRPPLVQSANVREKIARVAVAMAARTFSTDDSGERVIVDEVHVVDACRFLDQLYSYDNFGYLRASLRAARNRKLARSNKAKVRKFLTEHPRLREFLTNRSGSFRSQDLEEMAGMMRDEVNHVLGYLSDAKMVSKQKSQVIVEPELQELLRDMENL
jgi:hypothetical protein